MMVGPFPPPPFFPPPFFPPAFPLAPFLGGMMLSLLLQTTEAPCLPPPAAREPPSSVVWTKHTCLSLSLSLSLTVSAIKGKGPAQKAKAILGSCGLRGVDKQREAGGATMRLSRVDTAGPRWRAMGKTGALQGPGGLLE